MLTEFYVPFQLSWPNIIDMVDSKEISSTQFSDQNGDMFYSVLWLPPRYKVLCLYLLLIPVVIGLIAIDKGTVYSLIYSSA